MKREAWAWAALTASAVLMGSTALAEAPAEPAGKAVAAKNDYAQASAWLCRPGRQDACAVDLTTTVIAADGSTTQETFQPNPDAPVDCFYVYPTVSRDPTGNSDMTPGEEEQGVALVQAARFTAACRVYAPLYRQVTGTAMVANMMGTPMEVDREMAFNDVVDAWNHYLANDNQGRGVVLIGHSQGSGVLTRLIAQEIDGKPVQQQLISALLIGSSVSVPRGQDVGGAFKSIPVCRAPDQLGCVVSYAAFRDTVPPPEDSLFARPGRWEGPPDPNKTVVCANPSDLSGQPAEPHSYFTASGMTLGSPLAPPAWVKPPAPAITTTFVSTPGLLTTRCVSDEHGTYLSVHVNGDLADPRTDDIAGDVVAGGKVVASWGLHLLDMQLAMGDLVALVEKQAAAYQAKSR